MTYNEARREAMRRAAKQRMREGNRPNDRKRIPVLLSSMEQDGVTWELYDLKPREPDSQHIDNGGDWSNHKLVALPGRSGKANFWFGYNYNEARANSDMPLLLEMEPTIYAWVLATIDPETYGALL